MSQLEQNWTILFAMAFKKPRCRNLRKEWRKNAELMLKLKRSRFICEIYGIFEDKHAYFAPLLKRFFEVNRLNFALVLEIPAERVPMFN